MQQMTRCPNCGSPNAMGQKFCGICGAALTACCPNCGAGIPIVGKCSLPLSDADKIACPVTSVTSPDEKVLGLLDTYGYQRIFDSKTGKATVSNSPLVDEVAEVASRYPYPGDGKPEADTWATDVALELLSIYPAELVMLDYAQALFLATNQPDGYNRAFENIFDNIERFLSKTGYEPVILGCGGLENIKHFIDLENVFRSSEGFSLSSDKYAFIKTSTLAQAEPPQVKRLEKLSRVLTTKEFLDSLKDGYSAEFVENLDDYVAIANPGVVFKGLSSHSKKWYRTPALSGTVPVYTTLGQPKSIVEIAPIIRQAVQSDKKVALIIVEGVGLRDFPFPAQECSNHSGEFVYQTPWQQYITLSTGIPYNKYLLPLSNRYWSQDYRQYPFSGKFHRLLNNTLGQQIGNKKSLAVGNRTIFTHACLGADVSLECYCCYSHNHGTMAVFRDKALKAKYHKNPK